MHRAEHKTLHHFIALLTQKPCYTELVQFHNHCLLTWKIFKMEIEHLKFVKRNPIKWILNLFSVEIVKNGDETTTKTSTVEVRLKIGLPGD